MDENLMPLGPHARPVRMSGLADRAKEGLPGLFWFLLFPIGLFSYRATVPLALVYLLVLIWQRGWSSSLGTFKSAAGAIPLMVWAAILLLVASLLWTQDLRGALRVLGAEVGIVGLLGFCLLALVGTETARVSPRLLAASLVITSVMLMVEIDTGMMIHAHLGLLQKAARLNQSVMIVSLALFPVLFMLRKDRWVALATGLVVLAMVAFSTKAAAKLGFVVAGIAFCFFWLWPVLTRWLVFVAATIGSVTTPVWGGAVSDLVIRLEALGWAKPSATDRLPILKSFGAAVLQAPWFGYGFNGSYTMLGEPNFANSVGELRYGFVQGHPHNLFLQVFVETGLVGVGVMVGLLWMILQGIGRLERGLQSVAGAFLVFNLAVLAVSHGAWQAWWWAADLLAVVLLVAQARLGGTNLSRDTW